MQPTYLYTSDFDREIQWRSKFSMGIPILLGLLQMILTFIIIALEIASVVISPIFGTLYAGFWLSVIFTLSWISMLGLACCHRARKWATFVFLISLLCAAAAIALIVLDAFFIGNISRCFFSKVNCDELISSYPRLFSQPLGRKVQVLKAQLACAALLLATAILYILYYISVSMSARRGANRVLIEHHQLPVQLVRHTNTHSPQQPKIISAPPLYDPSQVECPHCGTFIKLAQKTRYTYT
ncbi:unnamed protein product [Adineta steineri]|uniref:Uncharacterized protein n=3 Tax=Adineta steineri TaxID=433720 RepID=A0A819LB56_9BILA|nr:unnamed protein product [Adineta steineri]CAF3961560.1 unnamed protein product [Adineta steineri]CAF4102665.1 unnamed protein product [Adineta steineri]